MSAVQTIVHKTLIRVAYSIAGYAILVAILIAIYESVSGTLLTAAAIKPLLILWGPTLALATHMGVALFVPLSIPLVALIFLGATYKNTRPLTVIAFALTWLSLGWYLYDLF